MRWLATTIVALGALAGASATPVLAAAAPGPGAKSAIPDTSQIERAHGWGGHYGGFGRGFGGIYIGPGYGYYGGPYYGYGDGYGDSYYDDDYYDYGPSYYVPRYRYRNYGYRSFGRRGGHWGHRHGGRGRRH